MTISCCAATINIKICHDFKFHLAKRKLECLVIWLNKGTLHQWFPPDQRTAAVNPRTQTMLWLFFLIEPIYLLVHEPTKILLWTNDPRLRTSVPNHYKTLSHSGSSLRDLLYRLFWVFRFEKEEEEGKKTPCIFLHPCSPSTTPTYLHPPDDWKLGSDTSVKRR